ncbi:MAG TPA: hypothetical protein GXZ50_08770 [Clostridia bacterium]|jgi:hypothetical protein|nr:hypothetical protein [Clostridia bacterium]
MEQCFHCGNCKQDVLTYYCTARNEFIVKEVTNVLEKSKCNTGWKKGDPEYEMRRRKIRQDRADLRKSVS